MSPRDSLWFASGALVAAVVLVPTHFWLQSSSGEPPAAAVAVTAASAPAPWAAPHAVQPNQRSASAGSLDDVTRSLAARLAAKGGSDDDWNLLARSYEYMGRSADAEAARSHVAGSSANQFATMVRALDSPASAVVAK